MAQEDDKKQNPTVQHYVVCKTQQKSIMFFCKLQQKNIAKPNRKALCFLKINRVHQMSLSVAWWKKQNNKSGTFFDCRCEQFVWSYCCWFTNNCLLCWMQKQKCILCFDTETKVFDATTKMYSLFWYNNKNVYSTTDGPIKTTTNIEQHFVFWNTDNLQIYDVCFDANKCVLRPIKDLFKGVLKAF